MSPNYFKRHIFLLVSFLSCCLGNPSDLSVTLGFPVIVPAGGLNPPQTCVHIFTGELSGNSWVETAFGTTNDLDYDFEDYKHPKERQFNSEIENVREKDKLCSAVQFSQFSTDLIIVFPGGQNANCTQQAGFCFSVIAKQSTSIHTTGETPCFDLYTGIVQIDEAIGRIDSLLLLRDDITKISASCRATIFMELIQGKIQVKNGILLSRETKGQLNVFTEEQSINGKSAKDDGNGLFRAVVRIHLLEVIFVALILFAFQKKIARIFVPSGARHNQSA